MREKFSPDIYRLCFSDQTTNVTWCLVLANYCKSCADTLTLQGSVSDVPDFDSWLDEPFCLRTSYRPVWGLALPYRELLLLHKEHINNNLLMQFR
jgi:hypothetical protein